MAIKSNRPSCLAATWYHRFRTHICVCDGDVVFEAMLRIVTLHPLTSHILKCDIKWYATMNGASAPHLRFRGDLHPSLNRIQKLQHTIEVTTLNELRKEDPERVTLGVLSNVLNRGLCIIAGRISRSHCTRMCRRAKSQGHGAMNSHPHTVAEPLYRCENTD